MVIKDSLHVLFRRIQPEVVIKSWLESKREGLTDEPICMLQQKANSQLEKSFINAMQNEFTHYSVDEAQYAFNYAKNYKLNGLDNCENYGVFGLIAKSVENMLTTDSVNECLCKYKEVLNFRSLTHTIDPTIFVAAYLAKFDAMHGFQRCRFSWNPIVRTNNINLHKMFNKGISENHFHIGGSSNAFMFSWVCLMNNYTPDRKKEFEDGIGTNEALDASYFDFNVSQDSNYLLTFKAACIRYFLYMRLRDEWAILSDSDKDPKNLQKINDEWLQKMLSLTEDDCNLEMNEVNNYFATMRSFCAPVDSTGFIPDYALKEEPMAPCDDNDATCYNGVAVRNYERRLFRPLAGEQRFLYDIFKAIFTKDKRIEPYLDVAYAYLLIYCRLRGELIQANNRIGFGNFLKYQDRKDLFTQKYHQYDAMRTGIAERVVAENPQIVSFEGRFCPESTPEKLIEKVTKFLNWGTKSLCGVSDYYIDGEKEINKHINEEKLRAKMQFVIHFPKRSQPIRQEEAIELITPRDNIIRNKTMIQANAIIKARSIKPEVMGYITGVDACSSEIDCRPEVFGCAIRKLTSHCEEHDCTLKPPLPIIRVSYHAGEDFLDPLDGLRAIDEAIKFCNMKAGDRLGHALALGIDCEEWYAQKNYTVLMRAQELLDNLVWLHGNLSRFDIDNKAAENEITKEFHRLFARIYQRNQDRGNAMLNSIDIDQYYASLALRGNDPSLYLHNPESEGILFDKAFLDVEPWQIVQSDAKEIDQVSSLLYHYYHYNFKMKTASEEIECYKVPKSIVDAVCALQEKMQYEIANKGIAVECNPSSNYLIGTFKDYLKHPLFKFNNSGLFPPNDERFSLKNPRICASINTDDLGIFDTSLENEYAIMASALENYNDVSENKIPVENIYMWLDGIRENGCKQSFEKFDI